MTDPNRYRVSAKKAALRYGKSQRTLKRWADDPALRFPRHHRAHGQDQYWNNELVAWDAINPELAPEKADA